MFYCCYYEVMLLFYLPGAMSMMFFAVNSIKVLRHSIMSDGGERVMVLFFQSLRGDKITIEGCSTSLAEFTTTRTVVFRVPLVMLGLLQQRVGTGSCFASVEQPSSWSHVNILLWCTFMRLYYFYCEIVLGCEVVLLLLKFYFFCYYYHWWYCNSGVKLKLLYRNQQEVDLRENHPYFDTPLFLVGRETKLRKICEMIVNAKYDYVLRDPETGKKIKSKYEQLQ